MKEILNGSNPSADEALCRDLGVTISRGEEDEVPPANDLSAKLTADYREYIRLGESYALQTAGLLLLREMADCCTTETMSAFQALARVLDALKIEQAKVSR